MTGTSAATGGMMSHGACAASADKAKNPSRLMEYNPQWNHDLTCPNNGILVQIEDNIPLPRHHYWNKDTLSKHFRSTLEAMKPGQSVVYADDIQRTAIYRAAKEVNCRIVSRKLETGGWRVWRMT